MSFFTLALLGCGGGGGGETSSPTPTIDAKSVSGYVVMAPVAATDISLYELDATGQRRLLAKTKTDSTGSYSFAAQPTAGRVYMLEASGGQYTDEVTGSVLTLSAKLRAVGVWQGASQRVSLSAYSEVAVRIIESAATPDWSANSVAAANAEVAQWMGANSITDFKPFDLVRGTDFSAASDNDFNLSWSLGGFSGMVNHVPVTTGQDPVTVALGKLQRAIVSKQVADDAMPYLIRGYLDYAELIPADHILNKAGVESALLTGVSSGNTSNLNLANALPNGVASGGAIQAMPNDQFLLVRSGWDSQSTGSADAPRGTLFNDRGALVAYQLPGVADYRAIYSASVAEVYGDGEVGFGRWNGGVVGKATRTGDDIQTFTEPEVISKPGESYVVAKPPTQVPSCGLLTLSPTASMEPFTNSTLPNSAPDFKSLRPDSKVAIQFLGGASYVGLDLYFVYNDGTVHHLVTPGGLAAPWASGIKVEANGRFRLSNQASPSMLLNGMLAGAGARKVGIRMQLAGLVQSNVLLNEQAVVFSAPDATLDPSGCATSAGSTGSGVTAPLPVSGGGYVLAAATDQYFDQTFYRYGYYSMTFGSTGLWLSATADASPQIKSWSVPANSPSYEVFGNASAIIGRAGGDLLGGDATRAFVPYALVKPTGKLPVVGSKHYVMVASTAVVSSLGTSSGTGLALGHITNATIDINYDQTVPPGSPPPTLLQNVVLLTINGSIAGTPFTYSNPVNTSTGQPEPLTLQRPPSDGVGGVFGGSDVVGLISGDNAEYIAFVLRTKVGAVPVSTAILLKAQP